MNEPQELCGTNYLLQPFVSDISMGLVQESSPVGRWPPSSSLWWSRSASLPTPTGPSLMPLWIPLAYSFVIFFKTMGLLGIWIWCKSSSKPVHNIFHHVKQGKTLYVNPTMIRESKFLTHLSPRKKTLRKTHDAKGSRKHTRKRCRNRTTVKMVFACFCPSLTWKIRTYFYCPFIS